SQMKLSVAADSFALDGRAAQVWMERTKSGSGLTDQPSKARSYSPAYQGSETMSRQSTFSPMPCAPDHSWRYLPIALSLGSVAWQRIRKSSGLPSLPTRLPAPFFLYPASSRREAAFAGS